MVLIVDEVYTAQRIEELQWSVCRLDNRWNFGKNCCNIYGSINVWELQRCCVLNFHKQV